MKVIIRKIKYKLNLNDGTVEKRWTHIPDDMLYPEELEPVEWPDDYDTDQTIDDIIRRNDIINVVHGKICDIITDYVATHYKGKKDPILDASGECYDWAGIINDFEYKLYRV